MRVIGFRVLLFVVLAVSGFKATLQGAQHVLLDLPSNKNTTLQDMEVSLNWGYLFWGSPE